MDTNGVDVFHVADGNAVSCTVTHHLVLNLFPSGDAALYQYLTHTGQTKTVFQNLLDFSLVMGNAAAGATQSVSGTQYHGIADFLGKLHTVFHIFYQKGRGTRLADTLHQVFKLLTSLGVADSLCRGSQKLYAMAFQETGLCQLHA